jgi:CheY-like chemotaxis protein
MKPATRPVHEICDEELGPTQAVRILCVDDNQTVADSYARVPKAMGHKTQVAYDGNEALRAAQTFRPDMVLLDIDMPGMNGYEVARRLLAQQDGPPPKIVALTGWGRESDKQRAQDAGFHRYVVKPLTREALGSLLEGFAQNGTNGASCPAPI